MPIMPFDYSVKIEGDGDDTRFVPATVTVNISSANSDTVSWGNRSTKDYHQPWPTRKDGTPLSDEDVKEAHARNYLSDAIPPRGSSTPVWVAAGSTITGDTIYYCCKLHPKERGTIVITRNDDASA